MPFCQVGPVRFYQFESLQEAGILHGIFTRRGGVSPAPWDELNVGGTVGDDPLRVSINRRRIFEALGLPLDSLYDVWQVHGSEVVITDGPRLPHVGHQQADAILTTQPGVTLFMRFADCVPILLYDPIKRVIGLAHAGWQGTVKGTAGKVVRKMSVVFGSQPSDILAAIGPSIAAHHYQVGPDVAEQAEQAFGKDAKEILFPCQGGLQFDLWEANRLILERSGVRQIEISGICTACHPEDWFSHRREKGRTGRFGVLISLSK